MGEFLHVPLVRMNPSPFIGCTRFAEVECASPYWLGLPPAPLNKKHVFLTFFYISFNPERSRGSCCPCLRALTWLVVLARWLRLTYFLITVLFRRSERPRRPFPLLVYFFPRAPPYTPLPLFPRFSPLKGFG